MYKFTKIFFLLILFQNLLNAEEIALIKKSGVYSVPVMINDSIKLNFVVDSGASVVTIPLDVFRTLARTGTVSEKDILNTSKYQLANGEVIEQTNINIREMRIGNHVIENVIASVDMNINSMLLLGQTALQKIEPWHIDTKNEIIYIGNQEKVPFSEISSEESTAKLKNTENSTQKNRRYIKLAKECEKKYDYKCALKYTIKQLDIDIDLHLNAEKTRYFAQDYYLLGFYFYQTGEYKKSIDQYFKAIVWQEKIFGKEHLKVADSWNGIGLSEHKQAKYDMALTSYFKALKIQKKLLEKNSIILARTFNNIGITYTKQSKYDEALVYTMLALKIAQKVLGENHAKTAKAYNNVADTYRVMGKNKIALKNYFKAMNIQEKLLGKNHPETAITYNNIGLVYNSQKKYTQALQYTNKALKIVSSKLGENHPTTKIININITEIKINKALAKFKKK